MSEIPEQRLEPKVEKQSEAHCRHCGQLACGELDGMVQFWCGSVSGDEPRSEECYENEIRNWKAAVNQLADEAQRLKARVKELDGVLKDILSHCGEDEDGKMDVHRGDARKF